MIKSSIRDMIVGDPTAAAMLATFVFTSEGAASPAVFTSFVPAEVESPYIFIQQNGGLSAISRGHMGGELDVSVIIRGDKTGTVSELHDLADRVWTILSSDVPTDDEWDITSYEITPPDENDDTEGMHEIIINIRLMVSKARS